VSVADLARHGFLRRQSFSPTEVAQALARAGSELQAAHLVAESHPVSAYELAYNAMLFAISALCYHDGYRAAAERHHATLVEYAEARLGLFHIKLVDEFDAARRKRHRTVYDQKPVSGKEAQHVLVVAAELIPVVTDEVNQGQQGGDV
jgi:uncharacterized protein (UPF0332 family)